MRPDRLPPRAVERSCSSLSSKSSRSSVAACSIRRTLVALVNCSDSSESSSDTMRPSTSESDRQRRTRRRASRPSRCRAARCSIAAPTRFERCRPHDQPHDFVDDQLADVQRGDRQQRAHEAQTRCRRSSAAGSSPRSGAGTAAGCAARRSARAGSSARTLPAAARADRHRRTAAVLRGLRVRLRCIDVAFISPSRVCEESHTRPALARSPVRSARVNLGA